MLLCVKTFVHETVSLCMWGKFHSPATGEGLSQCHVAFFLLVKTRVLVHAKKLAGLGRKEANMSEWGGNTRKDTQQMHTLLHTCRLGL